METNEFEAQAVWHDLQSPRKDLEGLVTDLLRAIRDCIHRTANLHASENHSSEKWKEILNARGTDDDAYQQKLDEVVAQYEAIARSYMKRHPRRSKRR